MPASAVARLVLRVVVSTAAVALTLVLAAAARAAPTEVSWPVFISIKAAPHTANHIRMYYDFLKEGPNDEGGWVHLALDSAGMTTRVTEPPSCYPAQRSPKLARFAGTGVFCPDGSSVGEFPPGQGEDFRVSLGDRGDTFDALDSIGSFQVHGGSGDDRLVGNGTATSLVDFGTDEVCGYFTEDELSGDGGNDRLYGRSGPDLLAGGAGRDYLKSGKPVPVSRVPGGRWCPGLGRGGGDILRGGSGNDVLRADNGARDRVVDCGSGRHDTAYLDHRDPKPKGCEKVHRHRPG